MRNSLGRGHQSCVYKVSFDADHTWACRQIARRGANKSTLENLQNELRILAKLNNPKIIKIFNKWRTEDYFYMLLEYCDGGDVAKLVKRQRQRHLNSHRKVTAGLPE